MYKGMYILSQLDETYIVFVKTLGGFDRLLEFGMPSLLKGGGGGGGGHCMVCLPPPTI